MMRFYDAGGVSRRMSSTEAVKTMVLGDAAAFVELILPVLQATSR